MVKEDESKIVSVDELRAQLLAEHPNTDKNDICLDEITEFKNLIMVGYFAHDRGCTNFTPYYFGKKKQFSTAFNEELMRENGYSESPDKLIKAFHFNIVNIENSILHRIPEQQDSTLNLLYHEYTLELENDTYVSKVWIRHPSGMLPENKYAESIAYFEKSTGAFIRSESMNTVIVQM
jgi:hypothetical protein